MIVVKIVDGSCSRLWDLVCTNCYLDPFWEARDVFGRCWHGMRAAPTVSGSDSYHEEKYGCVWELRF